MKAAQSLLKQLALVSSFKRLSNTIPKRMASSHNYFDSHGLLPKDGFSFQVGAPNPTSLKEIASYMENSTMKLKNETAYEHSLQYGCDIGAEPVRKQVAEFLTRGYKLTVDKDDLYITCGATAALQLILTHFFNNSHTLFVEDPTYLLVPKFLNEKFFMKGDSVPLQSDGIDLQVLEDKLEKLSHIKVDERHPFKAAVYVIPTYHNPTGICYSPDKCKKLVELARKHNVLVISDDIYNLLTYKKSDGVNFDASPPRLFTYDCKTDAGYKGNVISNGTFSKIAAPGLRVGWMEVPYSVRDHLNKMSYIPISGGGMSYYVSRVLAGMLQNGDLDRHVEGLRVKHKSRMSAFVTSVEQRLSKYGVTITNPDGGYFLWVKLPDDVTGDDVLAESSKNEKITFVPGVKTSFSGNFKNYIRLSLAYYEAEEIKVGVERFCDAVERVITQKCK